MTNSIWWYNIFKFLIVTPTNTSSFHIMFAIYSIIGKKIYDHRKAAGKSQEELGDALDLTRTSIANFEAGTQAVSISVLYKLALFFDKDVTDFLPTVDEIKKMQKKPEDKVIEDASLDEETKSELSAFLKKIKKRED